LVGPKLSQTAPYKAYHLHICFETERSRRNKLERQDEMRVHDHDARWFKIFELDLSLFHLVLYFKIYEIHLNFGSMLILVGRVQLISTLRRDEG
jgi:hypothetical protein